MDFGHVLYKAQINEEAAASQSTVRYYSTKFEPPKKEKRDKSKVLNANIRKFIERQEAEEKQKLEEARKKREELLALRAKDKKATRRVNVMLKRTKSANQSVIEDAIDNTNTAVTLVGPSQPDEDDYGYVSQEAAAYYNKMMEKYSKMPDEPKFDFTKKKVSTNLASTKDRVKAALEKEKEEALMPRKRKRKHKELEESQIETDEPDEVIEKVQEIKEKPKVFKPKHKSAPPPMSFTDLLKMAEKKQFEPVVIEEKPKDDERPLTKKQKLELELERERRERKERLQSNVDDKDRKIPREESNLSATKTENITKFAKIPKVNSSNSSYSTENHKKSSSSSSSAMSSAVGNSALHRTDEKKRVSFEKKSSEPSRNDDHRAKNGSKPLFNGLKDRERTDLKPRSFSGIEGVKQKQYLDYTKNVQPGKSSLKQKPVSVSDDVKLKKFPPGNVKPKQFPPSDLKPKQFPPNDLKPKQFPPSDLKPKQFPPSDLKPKQFPPSDLKPKQFPPSDLKPKQFPPNDLKPKQFSSSLKPRSSGDIRQREFPPRNIKRKPMISKGRILDDDDEEYDSEMDDFIDDGPEEEEDYSKYISEIFGYDKSKYRNLDDDVDNMESTFAQQMREEKISTRIGIKEDLEELRKEEEHKRRKAVMKMKMKAK